MSVCDTYHVHCVAAFNIRSSNTVEHVSVLLLISVGQLVISNVYIIEKPTKDRYVVHR